MCNPCRRLILAEPWTKGGFLGAEGLRKKGLLSIFPLLALDMAMGSLHLVIRYRKKTVYHCWDEKEIEELLKISGFRLKWLRKSYLGDSHLLLCAVKER